MPEDFWSVRSLVELLQKVAALNFLENFEEVGATVEGCCQTGLREWVRERKAVGWSDWLSRCLALPAPFELPL